MSGFMTHETSLRVTGPDGTPQWVGVGPLGMVYEVMMVSVAINPGEVVMSDPTNTIVPRPDYLATESTPKQVLRGLLGTATVTAGVTLGVAIDKCASDANGVQIRVAGVGSICAVEYASGGTTIGHYANRTAAGQVATATTVTAMLGVGIVCKAGNISGGSGNMCGILVNPL